MQLKSVETKLTKTFTFIVNVENKNVVVEQTFIINQNDEIGKCINEKVTWEHNGEMLNDDPDNFDLIDEILVFINSQNVYSKK